MPDVGLADESIQVLWKYIPGFACLLVASGFFSGSEAAYFSLSPAQRRQITDANPDRASWAARLLAEPDRLLMGILFWNLAINIAYFSLVSQASIAVGAGSSVAAALTLTSLVVIIVVGEFLPKSIAVMYPTVIVALVAVPLSIAIRILAPVLPVINVVNEASRRILWPGLAPEPYLELADLDRAVELSTDDSQLFEHERAVLRNIIQLSEIRVEEWMRPRTQFRTFTPPVNIDSLGGQRTPSGYVLITDANGHEPVSAVDLSRLGASLQPDLKLLSEPVEVVPWCATIAAALDKLNQSSRRVAVVVNEFGETIGIITWDDILEAILQVQESVSKRDLAKAEVKDLGDGIWQATGMTKLRRLERVIGRRIDASGSLTVGGVIQEDLRRLPEIGDVCLLDGLRLEIVQTAARGELLVQITATDEDAAEDVQ